MTEDIKNWIFSICTSAIFGSVSNMLLPEGGTQKTYKTVFCVFFLCIILSPLSEFKIPSFNFFVEKNYSTSNYENIFSESSESHIKNVLITGTEDVFLEFGTTPKDIQVDVNILENGSISINKFVITTDEAVDAYRLKEKIFQKTGIKPEIILSGEN